MTHIVMARDSHFYSELKQLNEDFFQLMEVTHKKSLYFDLTPTLKDYIRQFNELNEKYPERPVSTAAPIVTVTTLATPATAPSTQIATLVHQKSTSSINNLNPHAPIFTPATSTPQPAFTPLFSAGLTGSTANSSAIKISSSASVSTTPATTNIFGSSMTNNAAPGITTQPTSFFSFSTANKDSTATTNNNTSTFSFGTNATFNTKTSVPTTTLNATIENAAANDGDTGGEEDLPPPEPNVEKYEEPDAKFQLRCKLYERTRVLDGTASINLVGFGVLFVKPMETEKKLQVIFRQDPDLRKVLLNEVITPQIPIKQNAKTVQMLTPGPSGETKFYLVKTKEENDATELCGWLKFTKQ